MGEVNNFNRSKRSKPLDIDWKMLLATDDGVDDRPPELVITSSEKSKGGGGGGGDAQQPETKKEDFEYQMKANDKLEEMIPRIRKSVLMLGGKLPDKGEKLKATLRRCEAEVERRKKIHVDKGNNRCEETMQLSDQSNDGASCRKEETDHKSLASSKFSEVFSKKLAEDQKYSRTVDAFQKELSFINPCQGRKMKQYGQLSDRRRSRLRLCSRPEPCRCPTTLLVDNEKHIISNGDKKVSHSATSSPRNFVRNRPGSFLKTHAPQDQPLLKLRPRHPSASPLVDEEPRLWNTTQYAEKLGDCMKDVKVCYPSRDDKDSVEVTYTDMACLAPEACLSSTIMNFYIRYLKKLTSPSGNAICKYHFFNTYFYNKLQKLSYREDSFLKFRKWWKGVNIFENAYILLPVHENAHWSLGIICFPTKEDELGPIVLHLDSLGLHDSRSIFDNIRRAEIPTKFRRFFRSPHHG